MTKPTSSGAFDVTLEAAFGDDPLSTTRTWVDITADLKSWNIDRGRANPLAQFQAGRLTFALHDDAGDYDPGNTSGAYTGDLRENLPVRLKLTPDATERELIYGFVDTWDNDTIAKSAEAVVTASDLTKLVELWRGTGPGTDGAWNSKLTDQRVGDVLDQVGVPSAWHDLEPSTHAMIARTGSDSRVGALEEIRRAVAAEATWAAAFVTRTGAFRFDGYGAIATRTGISTVQATLSQLAADTTASRPAGRLRRGFHEGMVRTTASGTDRFGTTTTATAAGSAADDFGEIDYPVDGSQNVSPNAVAHAVESAVVMFGQERFGPKSIAATLLAQGAAADDLLSLELRDRVRIKTTHPAGHSIDAEAHVEKIAIAGDATGVIGVNLTLSAAEFIDDLNPSDWAIVDTDVVDTGEVGGS